MAFCAKHGYQCILQLTIISPNSHYIFMVGLLAYTSVINVVLIWTFYQHLLGIQYQPSIPHILSKFLILPTIPLHPKNTITPNRRKCIIPKFLHSSFASIAFSKSSSSSPSMSVHLLIFIWSQMWSHTLNIHLTPCHSIGITKLKNCLANQCISQKERNSVFCMNWEIKHSWESGHTVSLSMGSVGHQEAKPFKKLQYLAWN